MADGDLGARLRELRLARGLSQAELGDGRFSKEYVSQIERGKTRPTRAALARLAERQRAVIVLHDVEGFKHAEIGEMLGIPEGTARSDLHHARAAVRRALGDIRSDS